MIAFKVTYGLIKPDEISSLQYIILPQVCAFLFLLNLLLIMSSLRGYYIAPLIKEVKSTKFNDMVIIPFVILISSYYFYSFRTNEGATELIPAILTVIMNTFISVCILRVLVVFSNKSKEVSE